MDSSCTDQIYSEEYTDFLVQHVGNDALIPQWYFSDCFQIASNRFAVIYVDQQRTDYDNPLNSYMTPHVYGLLDSDALLEEIGVAQVQRQPNLSLYGQGIIVGFIDTGECVIILSSQREVDKYERFSSDSVQEKIQRRWGVYIMIRTFTTHKVRKQWELTGSLWNFTPCQGEKKGNVYQVATPSCWESYPEFSNYRGAGEYSRKFTAGGTIRLELKGVSHTATVFLDGQEIARHYNAYTIFSVIAKDLVQGEHTLTIRADNRFSEESALHIPNDYMSYGGVSRPVVMEEVGEIYIRYIHVTPYCENGEWKAKIEIALQNISDKEICTCVKAKLAGKRLFWENEKVPAHADAIVCATEEFENIRTWTPGEPNLYTVEAYLIRNDEVIDDLIDRFGFREVKLSGKDILLNGKRLRIRGFCRHEDHPQFGCALPYEAMAADLELVKHLGANSIRTAHYPNDERFLDLCDEQGILVWEENHARGLNEDSMRNKNFEPQAEQVIEEMIPAHYNHPSIYIWGILNECASDSEYGRECYRKQFELIRRLDSSRPHSFASCKIKTDISLGLPDVVSYNIYPLWYLDTPVEEYLDDLYQWIQNETDGRGKPFLVTEIGAGGIYGYRNPSHSKWTEEYQAETLEKQISAVLAHSDCVGVYIWQFCDVRVSDEWFAGRPRTMNNKGVVDEYRRPKLCYDVVKRLFERGSL